MARAAKKETAVSLENVLWNCRVALRGVGSTEKNRDAVIALVFLKFAGDKFEKRRTELIAQYGEIPAFLEKASFYNAVNVFYLKETARWSYIVKHMRSTSSQSTGLMHHITKTCILPRYGSSMRLWCHYILDRLNPRLKTT